jgi:AbrB family looped-hinge helix DNA binding protein
MAAVTVSEKGQVVIPAAMRHGLGIKAGTQLEFSLEGHSIRVSLIHPVPPASIDSGYGLLTAKPARKPRKLEDFDAAQAMRRAHKP